MDKDFKYGKVIDHARTVLMRRPKPIVQDSELERFQETGHRNVHAFLRGEAISKNEGRPFGGREIIYDDDGAFRYTENNAKFTEAKFSFFCPDGVFVLDS